MGISGKTVLITRDARQSEEFIRLIERDGGRAVVVPTIEITPPESWDACDGAIQTLDLFDGLIFTSTNGVRGFLGRMAERGAAVQDLASKMVFAVGEKTGRAAGDLGVAVTGVPDTFTAADLSAVLSRHDLRGKCFLFPRGNIGGNELADTLKSLGARVEPVEVYATARPEALHVDTLRSLFSNVKIDVAAFTSPSTFRNLASLFSPEEFKSLCGRARIAVIGPVTARAVEAEGLDVDIRAPKSTVESLVQSIVEYFKSETRNPRRIRKSSSGSTRNLSRSNE